MRAHVAFTPDQVLEAPVAVVVDVMRATSTIAQALASGYKRVYCCREVEDALALRERLGEGLLGGERNAVKIDGFDIGASPREVLEPQGETLIYSTTNGTRAVLAAASRCREVLLGSLLNLEAVARAVRDDCVVVCAGFQGQFALDDAYCAGRIVELLGAEVTDAAKASVVLAHAYPTAWDGLMARTYGPPGLEDDIRFCAQESVLDVVPRLSRMVDSAAEVTVHAAS
ncbi:MAG TPA: 2-phosphosulfolactate phosphatase [Gaiellaceae bacterium]|nr:2-phosphosulfolactate phosphatase [Gaiellaceae bacterium]